MKLFTLILTLTVGTVLALGTPAWSDKKKDEEGDIAALAKEAGAYGRLPGARAGMPRWPQFRRSCAPAGALRPIAFRLPIASLWARFCRRYCG